MPAPIGQERGTQHILVFGAGGATGGEVVRQALAQGHRGRASDRSFRTPKDLPLGVEAVEADVLKGDLKSVVRDVDALISCLGMPNDPKTLLNPPPLYAVGTQRIMDAMAAERVRRIVVISASFVVACDWGPFLFRTAVMAALDKVLDHIRGMEAMLRASALD